jgi:transcriptional regulator with XRE-family HTH domain
VPDPKRDLKQLGRLLLHHRHTAELSQDRLAAATGLDKGTVSRIERGEIEAPNATTLQRLAAALGTDVEDYYVLAGYLSPQGLPSLGVYLRTKYDASPELANEIEDYFAWRRGRDKE